MSAYFTTPSSEQWTIYSDLMNFNHFFAQPPPSRATGLSPHLISWVSIFGCNFDRDRAQNGSYQWARSAYRGKNAELFPQVLYGLVDLNGMHAHIVADYKAFVINIQVWDLGNDNRGHSNSYFIHYFYYCDLINFFGNLIRVHASLPMWRDILNVDSDGLRFKVRSKL